MAGRFPPDHRPVQGGEAFMVGDARLRTVSQQDAGHARLGLG